MGASALRLQQMNPAPTSQHVQAKSGNQNKWWEILDMASATNSCVNPISIQEPPYDCSPHETGPIYPK